MSSFPQHIPIIVDQHAEEAAFLWLLRDGAVTDPHYSLKDLEELDNRVEAHLDGLRIAGEAGWETCLRDLEIGEPGEVFAASVLAFESGDGKKIDAVVNVAGITQENLRALISALGWIDYRDIDALIGHLLVAKSSKYRFIGIAASAIHRKDPGHVLDQAIQSTDSIQTARAIKAAGELKRMDLLYLLSKHLQSESESCRFWSAWSAALLGDRLQAIEYLKTFAASESRFREQALQVVLRSITVQQAQVWLKGMAHNPDWFRYLVVGTGITGNPTYIPWLIKQMEKPELARVAGEAFSMITGVDLAYEDMEGDWPEGFEAGPSENTEDEDVAMDADEDLPWPEPHLVTTWWKKNQAEFKPSSRYLVGKPISVEHCKRVLVSGFQRQRNAAALELALMEPAIPFFETRAPGYVQRRLLGA